MTDAERFDRLWKGAESGVVGLIRRNVEGRERDDLLLEVRLGAWRYGSWVGLDESEFRHLSLHIAKLAISRHKIHARRQKRFAGYAEAPLLPCDADPSPSPLDQVSAKLALRRLVGQIALLDADRRDALIRATRGDSFVEIAADRGITSNAAAKLVYGVRASLLSATS